MAGEGGGLGRRLALGAGVGEADIRLGAAGTEPDAAPQGRQGGAEAGPLRRVAEALGHLRRQRHHVAADRPGAHPLLDQGHEPLDEPAVQVPERVAAEVLRQGVAELDDALGVVDGLGGVELGLQAVHDLPARLGQLVGEAADLGGPGMVARQRRDQAIGLVPSPVEDRLTGPGEGQGLAVVGRAGRRERTLQGDGHPLQGGGDVPLGQVRRAPARLGLVDQHVDQLGRRAEQPARHPSGQAEPHEVGRGGDRGHHPLAPGQLHVGEERAGVLEEERHGGDEQAQPDDRAHAGQRATGAAQGFVGRGVRRGVDHRRRE